MLDTRSYKNQINYFFFNSYKSVQDYAILMNLKSNLNETIPFTIEYDVSPINAEDGIIYGAVVLVGLYSLIVFDVNWNHLFVKKKKNSQC